MRALAVALAVAASLAACSSNNSSAPADSGAPANPFVGTWSCQVAIQITYASPSSWSPVSLTETSTVTIVDDKDGTVTATGNNDAGAACPTKHTVTGNTSTLAPNQTCKLSSGATATYTSGGGTVNDDGSLSANLAYTFKGLVSGDGGQFQVSGNGTNTYTCNKQ